MRRRRVLLVAVSLVAAAVAWGGGATASVEHVVNTGVEGDLTVFHYFAVPGQLDALEGMRALFNATYPNVDVNYESIAFDQLTPRLLAESAAGRGPDVIIYQWGDIVKLGEVGALASMEPYFSEWAEAETIPASVQHRLSGVEYDPGGDLFTIQPYVNLIGLYYNQEILDDVGVAPPQTIEELESAMEAVTVAGYEGLVLDWSPGVGGWWGGMPYMWANGVDLRMDAAAQSTIEEVFTMARRWVEEGYVAPDVVTFDQQTAMVNWLSGDYAFTVNGNWELNRVVDEATFEWGTTTMPDASEPSSVYLGGEGVAIGAFGDTPDLAWEYLRLSWLSAAGQGSLVGTIGSIPIRADVADSPEVAATAGVEAFVEQVATGNRLPVTQQENEAQTLFGDTWSAVVSGQLSPAEAAERVVTETATIFEE